MGLMKSIIYGYFNDKLVAMLTLFTINEDLDGKFSTENFKGVKKNLKIQMLDVANYHFDGTAPLIYSMSDTEFSLYFEKSLSIYNELPLARTNCFNQLISYLTSSSVTTDTILRFLYMFSPAVSSNDIRKLTEASQRSKVFYYQERILDAEMPQIVSQLTDATGQATVWQNNIRGNTNYYAPIPLAAQPRAVQEPPVIVAIPRETTNNIPPPLVGPPTIIKHST
jgi:hypothetical protein